MKSSDVVVQPNGPDLRARSEQAFRATQKARERAERFNWRKQSVPNDGQAWLLDLVARHGRQWWRGEPFYGRDEPYNRHEAERRQAASPGDLADAGDDDRERWHRDLHELARLLDEYDKKRVKRRRAAARDRDSALIADWHSRQRRKSSAIDSLVGRRMWAMEGRTNRTGLIQEREKKSDVYQTV